ncbi:MAG: ABC transporter ATP-binding protein [Hyphomicrobiaceae bacterium]|nr:ABC transporter ATP-binding protein [Hyphomicrobiaceae bacterium]MCC0007058.1 ABC transporter ATP-binding protein [Hyphomicrobiaceae bacterium]
MTLAGHDLQVTLGSRHVLYGADVSAEPGELIAIIGPNGAGKSTLLKALAGVLPLEHGRVTLAGRDIAGMEGRERGRWIAFLPQERVVHWPLPVRRVVMLGRLPHNPSPNDAEAVGAALKAMDLEALADRPCDALSGGELARVLLARALAQEAQVLIADEPTAGLDMGHVLALFRHLEALARQGRTVLVAVHDVSLALRHCHKTVLLKDGKVLAAGPSRDVVTRAHLAGAFGVDCEIATLDHVPIVLPKTTLT